MNSIELRNLQAPLKKKYRDLPEAALVTLKAQGKTSNAISCIVETHGGNIEAGLHPASGGNGLLACSGDMLLEALVACAGVTLNAVATAIGVNIKSGTVKAEGDLDFRGTCGVSKDIPVGFKVIRLSFIIDSNATEEQMESIAKLTERYCVVYQTLTKGVEIKSTFSKE
jgi:uncharacterized OsmC-like protein